MVINVKNSAEARSRLERQRSFCVAFIKLFICVDRIIIMYDDMLAPMPAVDVYLHYGILALIYNNNNKLSIECEQRCALAHCLVCPGQRHGLHEL